MAENIEVVPETHFGGSTAKLQYAYLLRIPILIALALILLPVISLFVLRELLGNLFVLDGWNIFWTMIVAMMLAWSILVAIRVVLLNGKDRFGVEQGLRRDVVTPSALLFTELLVVPMLLASVFSNGQTPSAGAAFARLGAAAAGIVTAHVLGFVTLFIAVLLSQRYGQPPEERYPGFPWMLKLLSWAYHRDVVSAKARTSLEQLGHSLPMAFRAGYFDLRTGLLYPGQWLTFLLLASSIALYWTIGFLKQAKLGESFGVPAIAYVLLLLLNLNWILSTLAFFLDRYRIPLILPILVFIVPGNFLQRSDHYYAVHAGIAVKPISPSRVLTAPSRVASGAADPRHPRGRVVVIATAGGGIQAAAWTAEVLTGLHRQLHQGNKPVNFGDSVAMISAVSGGAVGTLFFMNEYQTRYDRHGFTAGDAELGAIVENAEKPGLDDIAWALVYSDFWRAMFPYAKRSTEDKLIDRGWALEEGWLNSGNIHADLANWREGVEEGWRPAAIFNATLVETGEPLLFSTSDVRSDPAVEPHRRMFTDLYPNMDIPLVTAVRLASTFPFVTPVARAVSNKPEYHVADGGYYDNYGVYNLLEWLDEALATTPPERRPDILVIQIRSFPSDQDAKPTNKGWFYQAYAPVNALLNVRTAGQLVRDRDALSAFDQRWSRENVRIAYATFEFDGRDAPLSWRMNDAQIRAIRREWKKRVSGPGNEDWLEVSCFFRPDSPDCAALAGKGKKGPW
jgi:Patatin-like phospholipase